MKTFGFPTHEKLKHKKDISLLFEKGKWRTCGNLRIIFLNSEEVSEQKFGVSVSKRYFKKAVDRNRAKRLLRESYRLNKTLFRSTFGEKNLAMLFWISDQKPQNFQEVQDDFLNLCKSKR